MPEAEDHADCNDGLFFDHTASGDFLKWLSVQPAVKSAYNFFVPQFPAQAEPNITKQLLKTIYEIERSPYSLKKNS